jgi:hypothetical protein
MTTVPGVLKSLFQQQRLILRRLLRYAKGLEGCFRKRRPAPSGASFEAASRRLRARAKTFGSGSNDSAGGSRAKVAGIYGLLVAGARRRKAESGAATVMEAL